MDTSRIITEIRKLRLIHVAVILILAIVLIVSSYFVTKNIIAEPTTETKKAEQIIESRPIPTPVELMDKAGCIFNDYLRGQWQKSGIDGVTCYINGQMVYLAVFKTSQVRDEWITYWNNEIKYGWDTIIHKSVDKIIVRDQWSVVGSATGPEAFVDAIEN